MDPRQLLENRRVGRVAGLGALALRQPQLLEQDVTELLRRADRELVPDGRVDLALEPADLGRELAIEDGERLEVDGNAVRLHPGEDRDERQLDLPEEALQALL